MGGGDKLKSGELKPKIHWHELLIILKFLHARYLRWCGKRQRADGQVTRTVKWDAS
jgi:hypothetical protein